MPTDFVPDPFDDTTERQDSFRDPGAVGMVLFIASLAVLFIASLLAYIYIRYRMTQQVPDASIGLQTRMPWHSIALPGELWISTALVIGVSIALALAKRQFKRARQGGYRKSLAAAVVLAVGFLIVQTPAMVSLLSQHKTSLGAKGTQLYGLIFFMILLHALHVLGGMYALGSAAWGAFTSELPPPGRNPIRHTTLYWHFLDVVWIVMFAILYLMR